MKKMIRDGKIADVHAEMIDAWTRHGWALFEKKEPEPQDQPQFDLADIVDDRALPKLKEMGIMSVDDFMAADEKALIDDVPFITKRVIARIKGK